jgi:tRNA A37 threonylcarbamoyladenosine dehydratase
VSDPDSRFGGIARLYGADGLDRLRRARVCIVGIGGVGSWAAEALARSGVGELTLVDLDEICESNMNRQLHALSSTIGRAKAEVMAERIIAINPACRVHAVVEFFTATTGTAILEAGCQFVLDAIDGLSNKCRLLAACRDRGIAVVTCGAAGGRCNPAAIQVRDLAFTEHDRLLQNVRERLRKVYHFPRRKQPFGIDCVFSPEPPVFLQRDGSVCATRSGITSKDELKLNCESGLGSAAFVTGAFGLVAAGRIVDAIAHGERRQPLMEKNPG